MKCSFPDCQNPSVAKGFCHGHYKQFRRGVEYLKPLNKNHSEARRQRYAHKSNCLVEGCQETATKKGYCARHYMQVFRGNPLALEYNQKPSRRKHFECTVEGCQKPHLAKGFCSAHYQSIYRKLREML